MPSIMSDYTRCSCGFRYQSGRLWWVRASRFRPIDDLHEQLERIEKEGAPAELHEAHAFQLLNKCTD